MSAASPQQPPVGGEPPAPADFALLLKEAYDQKQAQSVAAAAVAVVAPPPSGAASNQLAALPAVGRACYTHTAMVNLMLERPDYTHAMLCAHFGRPSSWLASILASEAFQQTLDPVRHLIVDPALTATLHERYKALAIRTSNVMMDKLDSKDVTDFMVLKSGEIAMKALGMGTKTEAAPPAAAPAPATDTLAERLMAALDRRDNARTVEAAEDDDEVSPHGNI